MGQGLSLYNSLAHFVFYIFKSIKRSLLEGKIEADELF